jgi:sodium transport system permease protein
LWKGGLFVRKDVVWMIFRKELVDLFRDRKTLMGAFLIPIVVIPFVFFLLGSAFHSVEQDARSYVPIAVEGNTQTPLVKRLTDIPAVRILQPENAWQALQNGELRAIVRIPPDMERQLREWQQVPITIYYDSTNQKSVYARGVIEAVLEKYAASITNERLKGVGLTAQAIQPLQTSFENVASDEKLTGGMLAGIIPLMLVLSLASGGIAAATDLVAGEKERGTLESLVSAPIPAGSILTAKLLAVMVMSCISSTATLISLSLIFRYVPKTGDLEQFSLGFFSPLSVGVLIVTLLLLAAMFASLELIISTLAKTFKEAQTYMTGIVFLAMVPSYMMMPLNPVDIPSLYYMLPIFNGVAMCKEVFYGTVDPGHAAMALGTSLLYVTAAITIAARLFRREGAVLKG